MKAVVVIKLETDNPGQMYTFLDEVYEKVYNKRQGTSIVSVEAYDEHNQEIHPEEGHR